MTAAIKHIIHLVTIVLTLPLTLVFIVLGALGQKNEAFAALSQLMSLIPGKTGSFLRKGFFHHAMTHCHHDSYIGFGALFSQADTEIEQGVYIGPQCNIGKCKIERDCLLGSGVHILSGKNQHHFDDLDTPIRDQGGQFDKVVVGHDSWLGNGAIVMANIGHHCVVAAGSVVISDVPDYAIVAGNPARIIKSRLKDEESRSPAQ